MLKTAELTDFPGQLAKLVEEVQAGNEVLLTQNKQAVAKLVAAGETPKMSGSPLNIRSLTGHRVLTPIISQAELAEEIFDRP